jgi:hypothetical protein
MTTHLVKIKDASHVGVEPDGIARALSKLVARGGGEERGGDAKGDGGSVGGSGGVETGNELETGEDVAPLVGTADLDGAGTVLVEMVKVVRLEQLVGEFGKGEALVRGEAGTDAAKWIRLGFRYVTECTDLSRLSMVLTRAWMPTCCRKSSILTLSCHCRLLVTIGAGVVG